MFDTSFEDGDGGFTRPGPPEGTENPAIGWERAQSAPFIEGAGVATNDTVYTGLRPGEARRRRQPAGAAGRRVRAPRRAGEAAASTPRPRRPSPGRDARRRDAGRGPPAAAPPPPAGPKGLSVFRIGGQKLEVARRRGVRFTARCAGGCPLVVELRVDRETQAS